jgi:hypothetical protein
MQSPAGSRRLIAMITSGQVPADNPFRPDRTFVPGAARPL